MSSSASEVAREKKRLLELLEQSDYDSAYIISEVLFVYNKFNSIKWYLNAFKFKKEHNKDPWRPRDNL